MYELKHRSSVETISRGNFNVAQLEEQAVMKFARCPKFLTLATHVNLADVTPIHCVLQGTLESIDFYVPRQQLDVQISPEGHRHVLLKVKDDQGSVARLIVREYDRRGFLLVDGII